MDIFEPPPHLVILQTGHWMLNHRVDSALPGYLMPGAHMATNDLSRMPPQIPRAYSAIASL
jgi:diadenosine tetraphosphate (Ap4A) HIT family hydrolase